MVDGSSEQPQLAAASMEDGIAIPLASPARRSSKSRRRSLHPNHAQSASMANIASVLKAEIARMARKEVRSELESLKKASSQHRAAIAELKRQVSALQKEVIRSRRQVAAGSRTASFESDDTPRRFSAARLAAHRKKLGLSAAAYGKLVGMSGATLFLWEQGKSRPNPEQVKKLATVRTLGRRAIQERLSSD